MKQKLFSVALIVVFLVTLCLFFYKCIAIIDPDFGWHLTAGSYILIHGIPSHDIYSYTMPSYRWIDHEWLTDVSIARLYMNTGIIGLSLLFTLLALATCFIIISSLSQKERTYLLPFLLILTPLLVLFGGIRPQVISWLFFALTFYLVKKQKLLSLPFLFLLWANLHAGFISGLLYLFAYAISQTVITKKVQWKIFLIFTLSFLFTFINPYTWHVYQEIWSSLSDVTLHSSIAEWFPAYHSLSEFIFWIGVGISLPLIWLFRTKIRHELLFFSLMTLAAISSIRNIPLWGIYVACLMPTVLYAGFAGVSIERVKKAQNVLIVIITVFAVAQLGLFMKDFAAMQSSLYPVKAIGYLKSHPHPGNIFMLYNWGGYAIWKLPNTKVFIDGRMPSWRNNTAPISESTYAFGDYKKFLADEHFAKSEIAKYHIKTLVLPPLTNQKPNLLDTWMKVKRTQDIRSFATKLGFKKTYSDPIADIYER